MKIALIGPPGAGKSTVGELLADALQLPFVDADEACPPLYAEAGWSIERFRGLIGRVGYEAAHREWEEALAYAVPRLVSAHRDAVLALGAGHTYVTSPVFFDTIRTALGQCDHVVLLRPSPDHQECVEELRRRCLDSKGTDWHLDGVDWLSRWTSDGKDDRLATLTHYTVGETPDRSAGAIRRALRV